jgi:hypothetical protein
MAIIASNGEEGQGRSKHADLPIERPKKFEAVMTAKQIGLTIPPSILLKADKVIKQYDVALCFAPCSWRFAILRQRRFPSS